MRLKRLQHQALDALSDDCMDLVSREFATWDETRLQDWVETREKLILDNPDIPSWKIDYAAYHHVRSRYRSPGNVETTNPEKRVGSRVA